MKVRKSRSLLDLRTVSALRMSAQAKFARDMEAAEARFESRWDEIEVNADRRVADAEAEASRAEEEARKLYESRMAEASDAQARAVRALTELGMERVGKEGSSEGGAEGDGEDAGSGAAEVGEMGVSLSDAVCQGDSRCDERE